MEAAKFKAVKFIAREDDDFGKVVRKRVNDYFKSNNISRTGDYRIWIKVIVMPLIYLVPFVLLLTNNFLNNMWVFYGLWLLMGIGLAGCGLSIMHDANHGALSKKRSVNNFLGLIINLAGGYALNWKIQHNVLHHSYTNIDGYDEDIAAVGLMRFSPHQKVKPFFKFQPFYAWFLYGLMTISWATFKDFLGINRYQKRGLIKAQGASYKKELTKLIVQKILYYAIFIALPLLLIDVAWGYIIAGWLSMHFITGLILGCVFQPAHVIPSSEFPLPDEDNHVPGAWAKHQMLTTSNFAPTNKILSWYVGGLNYQIEHHLFPNVCHVHHSELSKIVKRTAMEFKIPYYSQPTFIKALVNHTKMLYKMSK